MRWWKRKNAKRKRTARRIGVVKHDLVSHSSEEVLYTGNEHNSSLQSFEEVSKADNENEKTHPKGVTAHSGCRKKSLPYANHGLAVRPKKGNKTGADSKQPRERKSSFWSFQVASVLTPATILQPNMHMVSSILHLVFISIRSNKVIFRFYHILTTCLHFSYSSISVLTLLENEIMSMRKLKLSLL